MHNGRHESERNKYTDQVFYARVSPRSPAQLNTPPIELHTYFLEYC